MDPDIHYLFCHLMLLSCCCNRLKKKQCDLGYKKNYFVAYHSFPILSRKDK